MKGQCYICGGFSDLERHHVYSGSYRQISEKLGLVIELCPECHRRLHSGSGAQEKRIVQRSIQKAYMSELGISLDEWITVFGKSWL